MTSAEPSITTEAAAAVPRPLRWLLRVQKPWSGPLACAAAGGAPIVTVVCFVQVAGRGRAPTWAGLGLIAGFVLTIGLLGLAMVLLQDSGRRFRLLYAQLGADRPRPPAAPAVETDEVRLVWEGPQRAVVHRGARRIGELHPDRPMSGPLLTRPVLGHGTPVDGDVGRLARAVLDRDGSRWRLALGFAEGPDGVVHRCRPGGDDESGEYLEIDGRGALEVKRWLADADLRWWELPVPSGEALRGGADLVWTAFRGTCRTTPSCSCSGGASPPRCARPPGTSAANASAPGRARPPPCPDPRALVWRPVRPDGGPDRRARTRLLARHGRQHRPHRGLRGDRRRADVRRLLRHRPHDARRPAGPRP